MLRTLRIPLGPLPFSSQTHRTLPSPNLPLGPFSASPMWCSGLDAARPLPAEVPAYLSSPLVFPRLRFFSVSFSSCWALVHLLCLVWLVPAMAWSWAQGQVWFISTVGHPWVVHSGAQEMVLLK